MGAASTANRYVENTVSKQFNDSTSEKINERMGAASTHHKNTSSVDQTSPENSASHTPVKEKPIQPESCSASAAGKQRRKTFSSLGIRSSFDIRGQSFDIGSSRKASWNEKDKPEDLTDNEKELLTVTWKKLESDIAGVGIITFVSLFETHPDVQQSFMSFKGMKIEDLKHSRELRSHALRVMSFVQKAVARLQEPEKLETLIRDLGKKHVAHGAKKKYVQLVGPQFILAIQPSLSDQWNDELQAAWTHLFDIIDHIMTVSMHEEEKRLKNQKD